MDSIVYASEDEKWRPDSDSSGTSTLSLNSPAYAGLQATAALRASTALHVKGACSALHKAGSRQPLWATRWDGFPRRPSMPSLDLDSSRLDAPAAQGAWILFGPVRRPFLSVLILPGISSTSAPSLPRRHKITGLTVFTPQPISSDSVQLAESTPPS